MSLPNGAMEISSILDYGLSNVYYITNNENDDIQSSLWDSSKFTSNGKPKYNLTRETVNEQILIDISTALPERGTVTETVFEQYPELLYTSTQGDIIVNDVDTELFFTFLEEGAGYRNLVGYFFYYTDSNGDKKIIVNDPNTNADSSLGYYYPTVVFPNASRLGSGGELVAGHTRKMRGNQSDATFKNINVGFFLIPNGWTSSVGAINRYNYIIHTTNELNRRYDESYKNTDDYRNGIHTILFNYNDGERLVLCMEDIERPGGDKDFNDAIYYITATPTLPTTNFIPVASSNTVNSCLKVDLYGMYFHFDKSILGNIDDPNYSYKLSKDIYFTDETIEYNNGVIQVTESALDYYLRISSLLTWENNMSIVNNGTHVTMTFTADRDTINDNLDGDRVKLYVFDSTKHYDDEIKIDGDYTKEDILLLLQNLLEEKWDQINPTYYDYIDCKIYEVDNNDVETQVGEELNTFYANVTTRSFVWGDPHIKTVYNGVYLLPNVECIYELYNDGELIINGEMWIYPGYKDSKVKMLRESTFMKCIGIKYKNEYISLNLHDLHIIDQSELNEIKVSDIIKEKTDTNNHLHRNTIRLHKIYDPFSSIRIIEVCGVRFECVSYPTKKDLLTSFCFDTRKLKWRAAGKNAVGALIHKTMKKIVDTLL